MKKKLLFLVLPLLILASCESSGEGFGGFNGFGGGGEGGNNTPATTNTSGKGKKITYSQALSIAEQITKYQANNRIKKARVTTYDDETGKVVNKIIEFDATKLAAYSWSKDDDTSGTYTFVEGNKGYYYYEERDVYGFSSNTKWYMTYDFDPDFDYDLDMPTSFNSRFKQIASSAMNTVNAEFGTDDIINDEYIAYYSNGSGHLYIEMDYSSGVLGSFSFFTEYKDYKISKNGGMGMLETYEYNFSSVSKPSNRSAYQFYGEGY